MIDWLGLGDIFAILAAIVWALSNILYKGFSHHLTPMQLNISKSVLASAMMLATIAINCNEHWFIKREPVTNKMLIGGLLALIGVGVLLAN
ncbi:EamA family transporter [Pseudoalteromonas prydzensis]|uniref:EamA family transporter n=1 Tax=Pseudoalteromonas prydzensis TaxID=182141 RepID=UPI0024BD3667|nr:EamA family transporter [Pseudoalteromonas prydzensis]